MLVRLQQCLLVRVGKKFLSAFPLPSALLGTENFFSFYVLLVHFRFMFEEKRQKWGIQGMKEGKREGYRERERSGRRGREREESGGERQNTKKL